MSSSGGKLSNYSVIRTVILRAGLFKLLWTFKTEVEIVIEEGFKHDSCDSLRTLLSLQKSIRSDNLSLSELCQTSIN